MPGRRYIEKPDPGLYGRPRVWLFAVGGICSRAGPGKPAGASGQPRASRLPVGMAFSPRNIIRLMLFALLPCVVIGAGPAMAGQGLRDMRLALEAELRGRDQEAAMLFDRAVEQGGLQGKDLARALAARGDHAMLKLDPEAALADYAEALELDPDNPAILLQRARAWKELGQCAEALPDLDRALELDPGLDAAYLERAVCRRRLGDEDGAARDLEKGAELAAVPKRSAAPSDGGTGALATEKDEELLRHYQDQARSHPDDPVAWQELGLALMDAGRFVEAEACFNKALGLAPDLAGAYFNRGLARSRQGRADEARADFIRAHELDPRLEIPEP